MNQCNGSNRLRVRLLGSNGHALLFVQLAMEFTFFKIEKKGGLVEAILEERQSWEGGEVAFLDDTKGLQIHLPLKG